jgi:acyl carrier protein
MEDQLKKIISEHLGMEMADIKNNMSFPFLDVRKLFSLIGLPLFCSFYFI